MLRRLLPSSFLIAFFSVQLAHTLADVNHWPLCSYNMFSHVLPERFEYFQVRLIDNRGTGEPRDPWGMMPIEFFRVNAAFARMYLEEPDEQTRRRFSARVLERVNDHPWHGFDETYAAYRGEAGPWRGFVVELTEVDFKHYRAGESPPVVGRREVYRYEGSH